VIKYEVMPCVAEVSAAQIEDLVRQNIMVTLPSGKSLVITAMLLVVVPYSLHLLGVRGGSLELIKDALGVVAGLLKENKIDGNDPCTDAALHWKSAEQLGTLKAFRDHLALFPSCKFATLARERITQLSVSDSAPADCEVHPACDSNGQPANCDHVPPGWHVAHCGNLNPRRGDQPLSAQDLETLRDAYEDGDK